MMILQYQILERSEMQKKNGKQKEEIIRHPGSLKKFGYELHESPALRRSALRKAGKEYGKTKLKEKLRGLKVLMKTRGNRMIIARDLTYIDGMRVKK